MHDSVSPLKMNFGKCSRFRRNVLRCKGSGESVSILKRYVLLLLTEESRKHAVGGGGGGGCGGLQERVAAK